MRCQGWQLVYVRVDTGAPMVDYEKFPPAVAITRAERIQCEHSRTFTSAHRGDHSGKDSQGRRYTWPT